MSNSVCFCAGARWFLTKMGATTMVLNGSPSYAATQPY